MLVPEVIEAAVTGAAILAARGIGAFTSDEEAVTSMVRIVDRLEPNPEHVALYSELFETYCALYPALREANWRLHDRPTEKRTVSLR